MESGCDRMEFLSASKLAAVASVRGNGWDNRGDCDKGATGPRTWGGGVGGCNCPRTGTALVLEQEVEGSVLKGKLGAGSRCACPGSFEA